VDSLRQPARVFRFGTFELDVPSGELRRDGRKVRLAYQPFQILTLLLSRPGEVVTREALRQQLWTSDTYVSFEAGLNSAMRKLREALDDSAENPRFIETLPRRGYRFIGSVTSPASDVVASPAGRTRHAMTMTEVAGAIAIATIVVMIVVVRVTQQQIARTVTAAIGSRAASPTARSSTSAVDPDAYESYLKGLAAAGRETYDGFRIAVGYFENAVAREPDFAVAHSALANAQLQLLYGGPLSPREIIPKAEQAARRALLLDDSLAEAHQTLGSVLQVFYWRWADAEREFRRARELRGPAAGNQPETGAGLFRSGRGAEALRSAERARQQDPLSFNACMDLALAYRNAGQNERAVGELQRALEITPGRPRAHFQLGVTFLFMDRVDDATRELEMAVAKSAPVNGRFLAYLGYAYAAAGRSRDARRILNELDSLGRRQYVSAFGIALTHDALRNKEAALLALERAVEDRAVEFTQLSQYPPFRTIAEEPRYQAVMRRIGLPQ
jgi:DNA-binding winged helix-turn-helix (wHTH) protein/Flp pilus assembly protein TadD